ncbi:type II secretion system protein [Bdellovibrio sp. HCB337]|uniref:type II secretion system protein n=1 Tax=Bdellovibrio sp. HCB337 TaxID=3394358 RepID=UPI0039A64D1E
MKYRTKEQGFSLLEVMIALAVVSFLSFAILQLVFTNLKATKGVEIAASLDNLLMEANLALKDPTVCQSNLSNFATTTLPTPLDSASINLAQITIPSVTVPLARTNSPLVNQPSTTMSLSIADIKPITTTAYLANIIFSLDKGQGFLGARTLVRRIPINLTLGSAGGPITGCNTFGPSVGGPAGAASPSPSTLAQICALFGQTLDANTGQCSGGPGPGPTPTPSGEPVATLPTVCSSLGGTYNAGTEKCTIGTVVSGGGGGGGGANPNPTPTPRIDCAPSNATCGGKTWAIGSLIPDGRYSRDWTDTINGVVTRCQLTILCQGPTWAQNNCSCVVVK